MNKEIPVITVDGPSGSGKGTISGLLAEKLGWNFLDSGAIYRVLALAAHTHAVPLDNEAALEKLATHLDVQFIAEKNKSTPTILLEGKNVTDAIRTEACGNAASKIAALPQVRVALLARQRAFKKPPGLVTDGRDMGTVVFPEAQLKFFLVASIEERARRRYEQLKVAGSNVNLAAVLSELAERDFRDKSRSAAPLRPAKDAILVDTTGLSIEEVLSVILREVEMCFADSNL